MLYNTAMVDVYKLRGEKRMPFLWIRHEENKMLEVIEESLLMFFFH